VIMERLLSQERGKETKEGDTRRGTCFSRANPEKVHGMVREEETENWEHWDEGTFIVYIRSLKPDLRTSGEIQTHRQFGKGRGTT